MARRKKTQQPQGAEAGHAAGGRSVPLRNHAERALDNYFASLNGHAPGHLYDLVLREVEEPLFRAVLDYAAGNQSRAAVDPRHQPRHAAQEAARVRPFGLTGGRRGPA